MKSTTELLESLNKESNELFEKIEKLFKFMRSEEFENLSYEYKAIITSQYNAMGIYHTMLSLRIGKIVRNK